MSVEKKILVFTATFNELDNIKNLVSSIKKQPSNPHILIIDDNSPDGTSEEIKKLQNNFKNLFLIKRNNKLGLDSAHKEAYEFALKNNYDLLITMDADLSHDPNELSNFIRNLEKFPVVLGSRYIDGGQCLMKGRRLIFSKYGNLIIKLIFQLNCNEFTSSYRGFNLKKLNNFHLNLIKTKGYSFFMGTVHEIFKQKFKVKEIPIIFSDRKKGYSKIPRVEMLRTIINLLILRFIK